MHELLMQCDANSKAKRGKRRRYGGKIAWKAVLMRQVQPVQQAFGTGDLQ